MDSTIWWTAITTHLSKSGGSRLPLLGDNLRLSPRSGNLLPPDFLKCVVIAVHQIVESIQFYLLISNLLFSFRLLCSYLLFLLLEHFEFGLKLGKHDLFEVCLRIRSLAM